jgi:hypothetical protein
MVLDWIRQNCEKYRVSPITNVPFFEFAYEVFEEDLDLARNNFRDVSQTALDVGSEVHTAIEKYTDRKILDRGASIIDIVDSLSGQAANAFGAFLEWVDENHFEPIESEKTVYGPNWAGTLDVVCLLNGKKTVIDYKTSKAHYLSEHGPQVAAYRSCEKDVVQHGVLRLDKKTGVPDYKDYTKRYERDLRVFQAAVNLYFTRHPRIAKAAGVPF